MRMGALLPILKRGAPAVLDMPQGWAAASRGYFPAYACLPAELPEVLVAVSLEELRLYREAHRALHVSLHPGRCR